MNARTPVTVRVTRRFSASAERVFDAWLDPSRVGKWLFATPTGEMVRVEIDARVGGRYVITERRDGEEVEHTGEYLEIDRPRRLVFTLQVPKYAQEVDRIAIDVVPLETGCELTLTHEMGPQPEDVAGRAREGWIGILELLDRILGEG